MEVKLTSDELMMFVEEDQLNDLEVYDQIEQLTKGLQPERLRLLLNHVEIYNLVRADALESEYKQEILERMHAMKEKGQALPLVQFKKPAEDAPQSVKDFYVQRQKHPVVNTGALLPMEAKLKIFAIRKVEAMIRHLLNRQSEKGKVNSSRARTHVQGKLKYAVAALYHYYTQTSGELPLFDHAQASKGAAIKRAGEELGLDGTTFRKEYYKFVHRTNRVATNRVEDIEKAIELLSQGAQSFPKAITLAKKELEEARLKK